jgi:hypothetical protein
VETVGAVPSFSSTTPAMRIKLGPEFTVCDHDRDDESESEIVAIVSTVIVVPDIETTPP